MSQGQVTYFLHLHHQTFHLFYLASQSHIKVLFSPIFCVCVGCNSIPPYVLCFWFPYRKILSSAYYLDIEIEDPGGWRAIHYAANKSRAVTAMLLELNPEPNLEARIRHYGTTPLILAAKYGCLEVCKLLLAAGADPNALGANVA